MGFKIFQQKNKVVPIGSWAHNTDCKFDLILKNSNDYNNK